ncbi:hypothetical protein Sjap_010868 [Stephania japonica]|uniref:Sm protein G n=1 Tax=Stephania japonica TaxID=461633 RepID=A0AAP0JC97_9MAGN
MSRSGQPPDLKKYMDKQLQIASIRCLDITVSLYVHFLLPILGPVKLNANHVVVGTLRGFDQFMNLVIDNTMEINGNEKNDIGIH